MILVWFIVVLLAGGLLALLAGTWSKILSFWLAFFAVAADLSLAMWYWLAVSREGVEAGAWLLHYKKAWIPYFGVSFDLSIDGLSLLLLILTLFLGMLGVLASRNEIRERAGFYYFNLLWILAGITGVFLSTDLFLFYFFWELMIIPMYFLIAIWGSENRSYASYKFFLFTQAGGLVMLLAILGLYFIHGRATGEYTFSYFELVGTALSTGAGLLLLSGFMLAFAVKLPLVPFHTWLPDAHSEAPTAGSLVLAGLLLKTGAYGIIRFAVPLFPEASILFSPYMMLLGVVGIIYGAVLSYSQTDLKRLIAYTSISHMGFIILGIFAFNQLAMQGVVLQMLTHGVSTGALFLIAGMLKERLHSRDIDDMGGLWEILPKMGTTAFLFVMASLGLPGLGNFIAEFLILIGAYPVSPVLTVCASLGLIFSAIYLLRIMQKVFLGPIKVGHQLKDFSFREGLIMTILSLIILWMGIYPQKIIDTARPSVNSFTEMFSSQASGSLYRPADKKQEQNQGL